GSRCQPRGLLAAAPTVRRLAARGNRTVPEIPRLGRRLPATALPHRQCGTAAQDRAGADRPARRGGHPGPAQGVREGPSRRRPRRSEPRVAGHPASRGACPDPRRRTGLASLRRSPGRSSREGRSRSGMSETMKIVAVTPSLREDSTTPKLTDRILDIIASVGESVGIEITTEILNIRSLASALTDMTLTGFRSEQLETAFDTVAEADAVVTVSPVYKVAP